ncbi:hypothetical protein M409DRAFT_50599 [Zasmidium cellare ATCC 36951]|uniref:Uncharacterized protein n=1 Tax=Zasmidium cellare ATCC 36951 TaxID=1080233 RepID=A0A6A6D0P9_ZASCE|nr:uncharacterized protein M409DRAFT_50599 [Zasmidium cellare ATCC 36951]KAF2171998.1 hypothetical protein M409DRAFT_50599 [Zasmidium cellare ATCC 36951]
MQRATYLAQLYESVSSIPPDIQQCLLTIAQYGCDADQVKRWYNLVRSHFGVGEMESPTALSHQTPRPIARARERKIEPFVAGGPKTELPVTPELRNQSHFPDPATWTSPPLQLANHDHYAGLNDLSGTIPSQQPGGNLFDPSTPLPQNVVFTGHGLMPAPEGFSSDGFNSDFMARSPSMPLLESFDETVQTAAATLSPRPKTIAPSSVLKSSPEQAKPPRKRRKLAQKETPSKVETGTMEPPPRPRRPSVPYRSNEQPVTPLQISEIPGPESQRTLGSESRTSHSAPRSVHPWSAASAFAELPAITRSAAKANESAEGEFDSSVHRGNE